MAKKDSLPNSLELLLDTMCNTFGGIMFIAIALVIITQISRKVLEENSTHIPSQDEKAEMQKKIEELEIQIANEQQKKEEQLLLQQNCGAEKLKKIQLLLTNNTINSTLQDELEKLFAQYGKIGNELSELDEHAFRLLDKKVSEATQRKNLLAEKVKNTLADNEKLEEICKTLEAQNLSLNEKIEDAVPIQTVVFSQEKTIYGKEQFNIFLKNQEMYFLGVNAKAEETINESFQIYFVGRGIATTTENMRNTIKKYNSNQYFISLWTDNYSWDALLTLRKWLRENHYLVRWYYESEFIFTHSSDAPVRVSE